MSIALNIEDLHAGYGRDAVLKGISIHAETNQLVAILGPSGDGKSTLLKAIAGLLPDCRCQRIQFGEERLDHLPPHRRGVAMMFQGLSIYPHLSVKQSILASMDTKLSRDQREAVVQRVTEAVEIPELLDRRGDELSGGQARRAALAKCLASGRPVRLLDEPMSGLDPPLANRLAEVIVRTHRDHAGITLLATHHVELALRHADQIIVLAGGRVIQIGTPDEIRHQPAEALVREFVTAAQTSAPPRTTQSKDS